MGLLLRAKKLKAKIALKKNQPGSNGGAANASWAGWTTPPRKTNSELFSADFRNRKIGPESKNRSGIEKVADSFFSAAAFNWADNGFARKVKEHGVDPVTVGKLVKGWQVFLQLYFANHQSVVYLQRSKLCQIRENDLWNDILHFRKTGITSLQITVELILSAAAVSVTGAFIVCAREQCYTGFIKRWHEALNWQLASSKTASCHSIVSRDYVSFFSVRLDFPGRTLKIWDGRNCQIVIVDGASEIIVAVVSNRARKTEL